MYQALKSVAKHLLSFLIRLFPLEKQIAIKEHFELRFWRRLHHQINESDNPEAVAIHERAHYKKFFTEFFGLKESDYAGTHVLDVGCGPMGSLEWADMAARRVGLDPLAEQYRALGGRDHKMEYISGFSEEMPFPNSSFDVVSSLNNLDHVSDVGQSVSEILRVTKSGGIILLITEIGHAPTFTEPQAINRSVVELFSENADLVSESVFGVREDHNLYASLTHETPRQKNGPGILCARFKRH